MGLRADIIAFIKDPGGFIRAAREASAANRPDQYQDRRVTPDDAGFSVRNDKTGKLLWSLRYDEVDRVIAYKVDRITTDAIMIGFRKRSDPARFWCLDEDMLGFRDVSDDFNTVTRGGWTEHWDKLVKPAFEYNWTVLWSETEEPGSVDDNKELVHIRPFEP